MTSPKCWFRWVGAGVFRKLYITLLVVGLGSLYLYSRIVVDDGRVNIRTEIPHQQLERVELWKNNTGNKTILLWTHYYKMEFFGFGEGDSGFYRHQCPVKSCFVTTNKSDLATADAVVFHGAEIRQRPLPNHTHPDQVFVFLVYESPWSVRAQRILNLTGIFNVTVSYMRNKETDIHVPYGMVLPRDQPTMKFVPSQEFIEAKTKPIAWLVSNCHPISARKDYGNALSKYIQVDKFGSCGNLTCAKANVTCYKNIIKDYMFMLAFENSYCRDYATEKLFRAMKSDIVPITLGRVDYAQILPPKSFIDVRDFESPRHLANYLKYLDKNRTAYAEYLQWKQTHIAAERSYTRPQAFCKLCEFLHREHIEHKTIDPFYYWNRHRHCLTGEEERKELHLI